MAAEYKDYYAILGVKKGASADEIKRSYRRLAKEHHPDLHPDKNKAKAGEKFKEINEAYEVLSDPQKKSKYDQIGPGWDSGFTGPPPSGSGRGPRSQYQRGPADEALSGFSDFFESLFGDAGRHGFKVDDAVRPNQRKGQDVEAEMPLSLEDVFHGGDKRISIKVPVHCPACGGLGRLGIGFCPTCGGLGETQIEKTITAHLPRHISDGAKLRLKGQGGSAPGGGAPGDLFLRIKLLSHPTYKVSGSDLETSVTVMPWIAALGGEASVPTLEGPVRIKIPAQTHSGRAFRVAGKGLGKGGGGRGDLYAVVRIDIPEKIDGKMQRLFEQQKEAGA